VATDDERPKHGDPKYRHQKQRKHEVHGTGTARGGKIIWSYMEPGKQAQTIRMIIEDQNASYCSAANIGWYGQRNQ